MFRIIFLAIVFSSFFVSVSKARAWIITPALEDGHGHEQEEGGGSEERIVPSSLSPTRVYVPPPAPAYYVWNIRTEQRFIRYPLNGTWFRSRAFFIRR
jgi:hypothetical protein